MSILNFNRFRRNPRNDKTAFESELQRNTMNRLQRILHADSPPAEESIETIEGIDERHGGHGEPPLDLASGVIAAASEDSAAIALLSPAEPPEPVEGPATADPDDDRAVDRQQREAALRDAFELELHRTRQDLTERIDHLEEELAFTAEQVQVESARRRAAELQLEQIGERSQEIFGGLERQVDAALKRSETGEKGR